jgi:hypothetical protein
MRGQYTAASSNLSIPFTLMNCGKDPRTCPHMEGLDIGDNILADAICKLPLPETVKVWVLGFNEMRTVNRNMVEKVYCGKCDPTTGVERG